MADHSISDEVRQPEAYADKPNQHSKGLLDAFNSIVAERNALLRIVQGVNTPQPSAIIEPSALTNTGPSTGTAPSRRRTKLKAVKKKEKSAVRKTASK